MWQELFLLFSAEATNKVWYWERKKNINHFVIEEIGRQSTKGLTQNEFACCKKNSFSVRYIEKINKPF